MKRYITLDMHIINKIEDMNLNLWILLENVYFLSNNSYQSCYASKKNLANHQGLSERQIIRIIDDAVGKGYLKKTELKHLKVTSKWIDLQNVKDNDKKVETMTKCHKDYDKMSVNTMTKCHTKKENIKRDNKKDIKKYKKKDLIELNEIQNHKYKDLILEFIEHRKELKKQMTKKALELFISKINDFSLKGYNIKEIVEKSILSGYMTIYEPKNNNSFNSLTASEKRKMENTQVINNFFNDPKNETKKITDENMFLD